MHHPVRDPAPAGNSQLGDRKEATLLTQWLTGFEQASGKPAAAVTSHAGVFSLSRVDGVPYLVNGNSGKTPAAAPGDGGFVGWTLLRADPADRAQPMRFETRPNVDSLSVAGPSVLAPGARADVRATLRQGTRDVPVAYPVSAAWTTDGGIAFDSASGVVTALRPGPARLSVTVNGVTSTLVLFVRG
jgi:hypothetical protein